MRLLAAEEKIVASGSELEARLTDWRKQDLRIGFTNGCFDILHPGHVKVLTAARGACDRLIVGLNSDASVKRLKGETRPVQSERARAEVLAALEAVDLVVIFEEDTPLKLIEEIKPSVLVKGGDYTREQVVGHEIVEAHGGEVVLVEVLAGFSTTSLVDRARGRQGVTAAAEPLGTLLWKRWRDKTAWMTSADIVTVLLAFVAAVVDLAGWNSRRRPGAGDGACDRRSRFLRIVETSDLRRADRAVCARACRHAVVGGALGSALLCGRPDRQAAAAAAVVLSFRAIGARAVGLQGLSGFLRPHGW